MEQQEPDKKPWAKAREMFGAEESSPTRGWHQDPKGEYSERFFDGEWTEFTRDVPSSDDQILRELRKIQYFIAVGAIAVVLALWITGAVFSPF